MGPSSNFGSPPIPIPIPTSSPNSVYNNAVPFSFRVVIPLDRVWVHLIAAHIMCDDRRRFRVLPVQGQIAPYALFTDPIGTSLDAYWRVVEEAASDPRKICELHFEGENLNDVVQRLSSKMPSTPFDPVNPTTVF